MALARIKNWIVEVLTADDLNAEFNNVLNNANSLISPFTADVSAGGYKLTNLGNATATTDAVAYKQLTARTAISVQDPAYAAVGDGVTDDSAAIQGALDEANARGGAEVVVPDGVYIAEDLVIYSNTTLRGVSSQVDTSATRGSILKLKASSALPLISSYAWHGNQAATDYGIVIENLFLHGNRYNSGTGDCLILSTNHSVVRNCIVAMGGGHGVHIAAKTKNGSDLPYTGVNDIERCTIVRCTKNGVYGEDSSTFTLADTLIRGSSIGICGDDGSSYANVNLERAAGTLITNSNIYQGVYRNIDLGSTGGSGGSITNCVIEDGADSVAAGNYIGTKISVATSGGFSVTGNFFVNYDASAVGGVTYYHLQAVLTASCQFALSGNAFASPTISTNALSVSGAATTNDLMVVGNATGPNVTLTLPTLVRGLTRNRLSVDSNDASTFANDFYIQPKNTNGAFYGGVIPNGTGAFSRWAVHGASDPDNSSWGSLEIGTTYTTLRSSKNGTGTTVPLRMQIDSTDVLVTDTSSNGTWSTGDWSIGTAGKGFKIKEGSNARMGTGTLSGGALTVSNTSVTANSRIFVFSNADGGSPGWLRVDTRTASTSFHIQSSDAGDTSTVAWVMFEPSA